MAEVARKCGVSRATVSSIINGRNDFFGSESTRQRVLDAMHALGYRPNLAARTVASGRSATVAMINTGMTSEVTNACFNAFEGCARKKGYMALAGFNQEDPVSEDELLLWMHDRCVDAMLLVPTERAEGGGHDELRRLADSGFPIVTFDGWKRTGVHVDDVSVDHFVGGQLQAQHMLDTGRKRLAIASSSVSRWFVVNQRIAGAQSALKEAGLPPAIPMDLPTEVHTLADWSEADFERIRVWLREHRHQIDGIICVGDTLGMAVMGLAMQVGISVPQELAVIGYNGLSMGNNPLLSLTSIYTPDADCGRAAFELIGDRLDGHRKGKDFKQIKLKPRLVVRGSTAARSRGGVVGGRFAPAGAEVEQGSCE